LGAPTPVRPLTGSRRRALEAICDTFAPGATAQGVPDALLSTLTRTPERRQLELVLSAFALRGFARRPRAEREEVLRRWRDSRLWPRRAAYQGLRKGALFHAAALPGPVRDRSGYPGPLGPPPDASPGALQPVAVERDTRLDCDVCVVGSGAGGGTAAGVLAAAGLDVVVVEAGGYYDDLDFDGDELEGMRRLYLRGGNLATHDRSVDLVAGSCLGGGTVVNWMTSFRTPDDVREEWAAHGVPAFAGAEFDRSLDAVCARAAVNTDHNRPSSRDRAMRRGLSALGWHVDAMPRNVVGCDQGRVCGYCGFGCRLGAKQSTTKTWLSDAAAAGARLVVDARAERVTVERGRATGVVARTASGHTLTVTARAVVAAAGALHTPVLLKRSGVGNANVGRHLRLHPVTALVGYMPEPTHPWEGTMQALYSEEHARLDGGYGARYETAAIHPGLAAGFSPWDGADDWQERAARLSHAVGVGILLRDRGSGVVRAARDGEPDVRYRLSAYDLGHVRRAFAAVARVLEAAGAEEIHSTHARGLRYRPGPGGRARFLAEADACGWDRGRCVFYSFHLMGSARLGGSPRTSACNEDGETWDVRDLLVADGSTFPTASGVNPMISIEAIAHMVATRLAARLA
jgi:long-chain-alcohol oxidase